VAGPFLKHHIGNGEFLLHDIGTHMDLLCENMVKDDL
jgi:hypothetical protein